MKKLLITILLILIATFHSFACLNGESKELKDGTFLYEDHDGNVPYGHGSVSDETLLLAAMRLDSLYRATGDLDYLSDKGLTFILLKRYDEAIELYLQIEKLQPGRYSTASNLGTTYELIGENEDALKWIKKSLEIDPSSHMHSEWIHVNILEAKIKGEEYYTTTFLLKQDFGTETIPKSNLNFKELLHLSDALYYQLNERVTFIKPQEKIVAQLLFDLGNIAFLLKNYSDALKDYELAKEYDSQDN